jgi:predicted RNase H-like HicB family nuclease
LPQKNQLTFVSKKIYLVYYQIIMKNYTFRIIIEPDGKNSFHGFVPILQGCHTWGKTLEETKTNLKEAIKCHIQGLLKDGQKIPREENAIEFVETFTDKELALSC